MEIRIITLGELRAWEEIFRSLPVAEQDPGMMPASYQFFSGRGEGKALCFVASEGDRIAVYPFLMNSINSLGYDLDQEYYDIQGVYGYNGIASNTNDKDFFERFHTLFTSWCTGHGIVAEFTRFNPVTNNHLRFPESSTFHVNDNVVVPLEQGVDARRDYQTTVRRNVRRAEQRGLSVEVFSGSEVSGEMLDEFSTIYEETMMRNSAEDFYLFDRRFFGDVARAFCGYSLFYFTLKDGRPVSCELVLRGSATGYSWLGGTLAEHYPLRPNSLLKDRIIYDLTERGLQWYCIGGGVTPGDGIFQYKRSFARSGVRPFYIGKRVHLPEVYENIVGQWQEQYPAHAMKNKNLLLGYREIPAVEPGQTPSET